MILGALTAGGGQKWLEGQMDANPVAFMTLVGKVIPQQIDATIRRELPMMTREELLALLNTVPRKLMITVDNADTERTSSPPESVKR